MTRSKPLFILTMLAWAFLDYPSFIFALVALLPLVAANRQEWTLYTGLALSLAVLLSSGYAQLFATDPLLQTAVTDHLVAVTLMSSGARAVVALAGQRLADATWGGRLQAAAAVPAIAIALPL